MADDIQLDEAPAVAPQRMQDPQSQAAMYDAQRAGFLNGMTPSTLSPKGQKEASDAQAKLLSSAMSQLVPSHPLLRKISHVVGDTLGNAGMALSGAGSGHGFEAARDIMMNARQRRDAEDQSAVKQIQAAHAISQMNVDPKMISNILKGYKDAQDGATKIGDLKRKQANDAQKAAYQQKRLEQISELNGIRKGQLGVNQNNATSLAGYRTTMGQAATTTAGANRDYKAGMLPVNQQNANSRSRDANTNAGYKTAMAGQGQQNANTRQFSAQAGATHMGNQDQLGVQNANRNDLIAPHMMTMKALNGPLSYFEKVSLKRELTPEEEEQYQQLQTTYDAVANEAYSRTQQMTPAQQPQPMPQQQGAPQQPQQGQQPQQQPAAAPQTQAMRGPNPQAVQSLAAMARQLAAQHPGMTPQQAVAAVHQQMMSQQVAGAPQ